jgi:hypothetical protein
MDLAVVFGAYLDLASAIDCVSPTTASPVGLTVVKARARSTMLVEDISAVSSLASG